MSLDNKLSPRIKKIGSLLGIGMLVLSSGCNAFNMEKVVDFETTQPARIVSGLAHEYCLTPEKLPEPGFWYSPEVYRQTRKDGAQERFIVSADQYDGHNYRCESNWLDVNK